MTFLMVVPSEMHDAYNGSIATYIMVSGSQLYWVEHNGGQFPA